VIRAERGLPDLQGAAEQRLCSLVPLELHIYLSQAPKARGEPGMPGRQGFLLDRDGTDQPGPSIRVWATRYDSGSG
jgi:hypothetical protein